MSNEHEQLKNGVAELGFEIAPDKSAALIKYLETLAITNESFNLTRIPREEYVTLHLLDSLTALVALPKDRSLEILDVGTGAGFPGVPLAALLPTCKITLLDSTAKKVKFASFTAQECGISNCRGLHGRAEVLARTKEHRDHYNIVISRAVAAFPKLMEWLLPLTKVGGYAIAMKGAGYEEELAGSESLVRELGGAIEKVVDTALPGTDIIRHTIVVRKERPTPGKFPR
jgi:16S rRNA (guanine527-N7)-methyltransferase